MHIEVGGLHGGMNIHTVVCGGGGEGVGKEKKLKHLKW